MSLPLCDLSVSLCVCLFFCYEDPPTVNQLHPSMTCKVGNLDVGNYYAVPVWPI